jgi:putative Ig domain-containing protein/matrixin
LLALVQKTRAQDYNLLGPAWPAGSNVVMKLGLGPTTIALQDGSASWNASAADALDIWNGYVDFITLSSIASATVPEISGDGVNATFFSSTVFGDTFGDDTLAVTVWLSEGAGNAIMTEADVVCNTAFKYDSYRGPLQSAAADLHRILLHEFGHVLGLAHSGTAGGVALMEAEITDLDHPVAGDIGGVSYLYGVSFHYPPGDATLRIGYDFTGYLGPNNNPTSYSATDLPPGITIDPVTGVLSGKPTTSGDYSAVVTAHGPIADASEGYHFNIHGLEEVPGLLAILPLQASSIVADPSRPRVYEAGIDGLSMIDTESLAVTNLVPGFLPTGVLSISADGSTLLEVQPSETVSQELRVDLESLKALPPITIPASGSAVLEGLNNQAYIVGPSEIDQFDATTGELQHAFATKTTYAYGSIAMATDRRTLYVARGGSDGELLSYDISGPEPVLLHQLTGSFPSVAPSRDGQFLYYGKTGTDGATLFQAHLPTFIPAISVASGPYLGPTAEDPSGAIFQGIAPLENEVFGPSGFYSVYDPVSLQETAEIPLGNLQVYYPYYPLGIAFDSTGQRIFANVYSGDFDEEVWVLSSDFASLPPPVHPTRNLLNISTRVRVEAGENAMIGGFIIQGPVPKKVLIRGLGPSLPITGAMSNPVLELHDSTGKLIASNDNWISDQLDILGTLIPPLSERESAILTTLEPGAYTAIVHDVTNQPGLSLVEVYDLDAKNSSVANISTRGKVGLGDNVMIGGFIIGGEDPTKVVIRAIGPSLGAQGVALPLADPVLEIHDSTGKLISTNDNWRATQQNDIIATGIAPTNDSESAILLTLDPGSYTAIVRGQNSTTGVALVEVYNLDSATSASK